MHVALPQMVKKEVSSALDVLRSALVNHSPNQEEIILNAPSILFVSVNVANNFPHIPEAVLIQNYQSYLPGALCKEWVARRGDDGTKTESSSSNMSSFRSVLSWVSLWILIDLSWDRVLQMGAMSLRAIASAVVYLPETTQTIIANAIAMIAFYAVALISAKILMNPIFSMLVVLGSFVVLVTAVVAIVAWHESRRRAASIGVKISNEKELGDGAQESSEPMQMQLQLQSCRVDRNDCNAQDEESIEAYWREYFSLPSDSDEQVSADQISPRESCNKLHPDLLSQPPTLLNPHLSSSFEHGGSVLVLESYFDSDEDGGDQ